MATNSELDEQFMRQSDFMPRQAWSEVTLHIVGCGGIGSVAALALAKVGAQKIVLYDDDTIERHNVANQMLHASSRAMGIPKVSSLGLIISDLGGDHIEVIERSVRVNENNRIRADEDRRNIVICGPDSMEARQSVWSQVKGNDRFVGLVEGRMACRMFRLYAIDPRSSEQSARYEQTLYSDEGAEQLPCSDRAVFHTNMILGACIVEQVRRIVYPNDGYKTPNPPFEILFDLASFRISTNS